MRRPVPDSYWLIDGLLLAGEYPSTRDPQTARVKLGKYLDAGIRTFIDLTEDGELDRYDGHLRSLAAERGIEVKHLRHPIRDFDIPRERSHMVSILEASRDETGAGRPVYIHCWGGIGRTGTVAGCWLVEQGMTGDEALSRIAQLRRDTPDGRSRSPESDAQCRYVLEWRLRGAEDRRTRRSGGSRGRA